MKSKLKKILLITAVAAVVGLSTNSVYAMHIAEGMLSPFWSVLWSAAYIPFFIWGYFAIKKKCAGSPRLKMLLAMSGAFCFVLSALKIPSVTGSSSHPTGVGIGTVLYGPAVMSFVGFIVLLFQALILAHGGLTTLGANSFSMAVAGPFAGYAVYCIARKLKAPAWLSVFLSAFIADLFTYVVTSFQLALAFPADAFTSSLVKFMTVFALTQIPLAVIEGIVTVMVYNAVNALCTEEVTLLTSLNRRTA